MTTTGNSEPMTFEQRAAWLHHTTSYLAASADPVEQKFLLKRLIEESKTALDEIDEHLYRLRVEQKRRDREEVSR